MARDDLPTRLGKAVLATTLVVGIALGATVGACAAKRSDSEIEQAAFERLRGEGNVPGIGEESATSEITGRGFQPSDSPPKCLPNGTVTYEVFDSAANRRYWVFRWPEDKGYSIVPRDMVDEDGNVVPYTPGYERQLVTERNDDATVTKGEVSLSE